MLTLFHRKFLSTCVRNGIARMMATEELHFRERLSLSVGGSVSLTKENDIAIIRVERPEKKNAFTGAMMLQLSNCVSQLELSCPRVILVTGTDKSFSAGADLDLVKQNLDSQFAESMFLLMNDTFSRLRSLPAPSVALVNGPAFGGGAELAVQCDLRLVTPEAVISFVHGQMGLTPGWGAGRRLVDLLGYAKAMELLLTGRRVTADDAVAIGLACGKLESEKEGLEWINRELKGSARTLIALKTVVTSAKDGIDLERSVFVSQWGAEDHVAALEKVIK